MLTIRLPSLINPLQKAIDALRGPPSAFAEWQKAIDALRGPPAEFGIRVEYYEPDERAPASLGAAEWTAVYSPDSRVEDSPKPAAAEVDEAVADSSASDLPAADPAGTPAADSPVPAAATKPKVGAPFTHDWPKNVSLDADYCRTFYKKHNLAPTRKERYKNLEDQLGINCTPHWKTVWKHLPKEAPIDAGHS